MKYNNNNISINNNNLNNSDGDEDDSHQPNNNNRNNKHKQYLKHKNNNDNKKDKYKDNYKNKNKINNNKHNNKHNNNIQNNKHNNRCNNDSDNDNILNNDNDNDNDNYNNLNNILFYKIWKNVYLKSKIIYMVKLYNIHQYTRKFERIESLFENQYCGFIEKVEFQVDQDGTNILERLTKSRLNIKKVKLTGDYNYDIDLSTNSSNSKSNDDNNNYSNNNNSSNNITTIINLEILNFTKDNLNLISLGDIKRFRFENLNLQFNFTNQFNSVLLNSSIEKLTLHSFNFSNQILPNSLKKLVIINPIKENINSEFKFPPTLTYLDITINELDIKLPDSLKVLKLSAYKVNEDCIPSESLEQLVIDTWSLNHKIIPQKNLKKLEIGGLFDKSLIDSYGVSIIPKSLESLMFSSLHVIGRPSRPGFNQTIGKKEFNNCRRLKSLSFNCDFDQQLSPNVLPENLTSLSFTEFDNGGLPLTEKNTFPVSLTSLDLGLRFNQKISFGTSLPKLKKLCMGEYYNQKFIDKSLPDSLIEFEILNQNFRHPIPINFSKTSIKCNYNLKKIKSLSPETLTSIKLSKCKRNTNFDQDGNENELNNNIDNNINNIDNNIDNNNNKIDNNSNNMTPSLKNKKALYYLEFDKHFNESITIENLPKNNNIKVLVLGSSFNNQINLEDFKNLEELFVYGNPIINPTTTVITNSNNQSINQYDFLKLKYIKTPVNNINFLNNVNNIFYNYIILLDKN